ncbi:6-phosphofructokinase [Candidatus Sumerlaeota bacterium]|nr:6-phosphofructokinase [Candidatus Sumerlaeota bacterium]
MAIEKPLKGVAVIGQSGGPTCVINQSVVGAVTELRKSRHVTGIYGARHGVAGMLKQDFINLAKEDLKTLRAVAETPSAALGSVRKKPTPDECRQVFENFRRHNVRYFFYIGGNDTAETAHIVNEMAKREAYDLRAFHIPKTIDNDLLVTDHCPGFGSAAKFVAQAFMGDDLDNRSLNGIKINIVMGRHAGFLTAASVLGRTRKDDGPHLVYVPERPFDMDKFIADVDAVYTKLGRCLVAVSEGVADEKGESILHKFAKSDEVDAHGNIQLSGTGALGDLLASFVKKGLGSTHPSLRVRADTFGYLQRCFPGVVSKVDQKEAFEAGRMAVKYALGGDPDGSVAIERAKGAKYAVSYFRTPLSSVAKETTHLSDAFINAAGNDITKAFVKYALPLVGDLPKTVLLKGYKVAKKG